ncbi:MAG: TIGR03084 family metal-binding protein [Parasphingorhabdus sp.]|nr:TIGR03084 family metal-binding protein [Parasphingorhabdus sp.]
MIPEAEDFRCESAVLVELLDTAPEAIFATATQFKQWTVDDVIAHLFLWNHAACLTLTNPEAFTALLNALGRHGGSHLAFQRQWLAEEHDGAHGRALLNAYRAHFALLAAAYSAADPEQRVAWAGPPMTTRAKIIARQMESWAHGQAVFDLLGVKRHESDRIRNIAHLGVTTYSWTFRNRRLDPPQRKPFVSLTGPSGAVWTWNDPQDENQVSGSAVEFAQVVTQVRNIADTALVTRGTTAQDWMAVAQCFAGPPENPPAPGTRYRLG